MNAKVLTKHEFYDQINLKKYLTEEAQKKNGQDCDYTLVNVMLHQGRMSGAGHYFAFGKHNNKWYQFNDEDVESVDESIMKLKSFGGTISKISPKLENF